MRTLTLSHDYTVGLPDFLAALAAASTWEELGSRASTQRVDPDTEVTVRTQVPANELPATLASQLPSGAELVEVYMVPGDVIGDAAEVRMTAHAAGVPVEIDALITLTGRGTGTALEIRAEISSSVPLFGSMIEQALVPVLEARLTERLDALAEIAVG
ncbi:DUF2505 domain-containing protein [Brevibacterium metallidurans]|uniref:DUF2505 domain-containing protein n=1 Tax=Brevibacterium metallidurans TaxID=1482676 RepID=A0ABP3C9M5_9MICO